MDIDPVTQLETMREGLAMRPEDVDTSRIAPVLVPIAFFATGKWPGPYCRLRAAEVGLTWSVLLADQTMRYVNHELKNYWEARELDWRELALGNLAQHTGESLSTHEFRRPNGELYAIAMMHADGIGPSRLLLRDRLSELFTSGYRIAVPEMSCAFAFSVEVDEAEMSMLHSLIDECYRGGIRPLAADIYGSDDMQPMAELE